MLARRDPERSRGFRFDFYLACRKAETLYKRKKEREEGEEEEKRERESKLQLGYGKKVLLSCLKKVSLGGV